MKARNIIQALWPTFWLFGAVNSLFTMRDVWSLPIIVVFGLWLFSAISLHPSRPWSWWACLAPVTLALLAGVGCIGGLLHMALFPDAAVWANANQTGALAIMGAFFYLVPSSLLLWHLLVVRPQFSKPRL